MSVSHFPTAIDRTITLPDGRSLGYAVYGDPAGQPILHVHGFSRLGAGFLHEQAAKAGLCVVGVDRPGVGLSDFRPGHQFLDWPDDVVALTNALDIDRFAVLGICGGGPFAAACAYQIPERLTACGFIAGLAPLDRGTTGLPVSTRMLFAVARRLPWILEPLIRLLIERNTRDREKAERYTSKAIAMLPAPDREALAKPALRSLFVQDFSEVYRQGSKGAAHDHRLLGRSWGFEPEDIACDNVYWWHGDLDANVPISMGRLMAAAIPNCQATFYPNQAHYSLICDPPEEIVTTLAMLLNARR